MSECKDEQEIEKTDTDMIDEFQLFHYVVALTSALPSYSNISRWLMYWERGLSDYNVMNFQELDVL